MKNPKRALPPARWLSRRQAAQVLGTTESEISKLDGVKLHPRRETDRSWRYDVAEVRALLSGQGWRPGQEPSGETTAAVFELFEQGRSLPQAVIATRQPAAVVQQLRREYDDMAGSLLLPADILEELRSLLAPRSIAGPDDLVAAVKLALITRYQLGYQDGRAEERMDFGEVIDPRTGERRKVAAPAPRCQSHPSPVTTASDAATPHLNEQSEVKPPPT